MGEKLGASEAGYSIGFDGIHDEAACAVVGVSNTEEEEGSPCEIQYIKSVNIWVDVFHYHFME